MTFICWNQYQWDVEMIAHLVTGKTAYDDPPRTRCINSIVDILASVPSQHLLLKVNNGNARIMNDIC